MSSNLGNSFVVPGGIESQSSVPLTQLGSIAVTNDGRKFRYVRAGGTGIAAGILCQSVTEDTTNWENLSVAAAAAGSRTVTTTSTVTLAANLLAGGYLTVTTTPGIGYTYKIAGNSVAAAAVVNIYLEDPIVVALTTASKIDVIPDPDGAVVIFANGTGTHTGNIRGVAVYPLTAYYYGWLQIGGVGTVLGDSNTITVGSCVVGSKAIDGAVGVQTEVTDPIVGTAITGIASTEYGLVNLQIG